MVPDQKILSEKTKIFFENYLGNCVLGNSSKFHKNFEENFEYNNRSNKFDLRKYEKNIQDNLTTKLSDEIIRYLNSLR